jgi:tetratricopeptide (TPR) repeat protein
VHRFEGTVNQVLGDGIMALFGAPIAHEDHAVRACYAALAMQAAMRPYTEEVRRSRGLELHIRVGLHSGEVVVRAIGNDLHMDYSAVGETTHLAARMEQLATPGSIRLTAATLRLVEGLVQVSALGPVPVKELAEPVEIFELLGASGTQRRVQAAVARGLTRFVGRQTEMATLTDVLAQASASHGQVVTLVGEAGVGKSRLVYEFTHSHHIRGWLVLESASVSYGKATPYFPVIDLLKRYAHVEEHDNPRTIRAKVTGQVLTLDEALQDTIPALLSLLEALPGGSPFLQLDPPQRRQRTLTALKRVLLRESRVQPLLLVFEDLHWIDSETQALLDNLVESLPMARLLLLANYRPEYQHGWGAKTYYTQVRLDPLPIGSAEELLQVLLGNDSGLMPLKQQLIARTEGNPFFLEESVRAVAETGVLVGEPGAYRLGPWVAAAPRGRPEVGNHRGLPLPMDIHIPATVQAVLAARIDRLPPEEKRLLQTAAVIGNEIPLPLLQRIAELPEEALHRGLAHLQAAEFLYETRLFPESEYTFKHATELGESALQEQASHTLGQAYNAIGDFGRAADLWRRNVEAADRESGTPSTDVRIQFRAWLARTLGPLGAFTEGQRHGEEALRLATLAGQGQTPSIAYGCLGNLYLAKGDLEHAIRVLDQGLALCRVSGNRSWFRAITASLGSASALQGRLAEGQALLEEAISESTRTGAVQNQAYWVTWLSEVCRLAGRGEEAWQHAGQALDLARQHKERANEALALHQLGVVHAHTDPPDAAQAEAYYQQALALADELGMRPLVAHCHLGLGTLYTKIGRREHGCAELSAAIDLYRAMEMTFWLPQAEATLAEAK